MLKKIYLFIIFFLALVVSCSADVLYDHKYLQSLNGGFIDTVSVYTAQEGLPLKIFISLLEKRAEDMSSYDLKIINKIRAKQLKPTSDVLMQKVISVSDMDNYISGKYKAPKGFVSICADIKQYKTVADFYYGLRLDYSGTRFKPEDNSCGVIRFKAINITSAFIPKSPFNGGEIKDPYPFGGTGFTTGCNGRFGTPEWVLPDFAVMDDGAQIFEVFKDGSEKLRAVYRVEADRFVESEKL